MDENDKIPVFIFMVTSIPWLLTFILALCKLFKIFNINWWEIFYPLFGFAIIAFIILISIALFSIILSFLSTIWAIFSSSVN